MGNLVIYTVCSTKVQVFEAHDAMQAHQLSSTSIFEESLIEMLEK